jgi:acetyltransferase-like isoleucine patch superfamily enzyme
MKRTWRNLLYSAWDFAWIYSGIAISTLLSRLSLAIQGCAPGEGFRTSGRCSFKARREGSLHIGKGVSLLAGWRSNRAGLTNPVLLETLGNGVIVFGDNSGGSAVVISSRKSVSVGERVCLGANVRIFDHDFHAIDPTHRQLDRNQQEEHVRSEAISIGNDAFVGANAIILKGVVIGDRSIVAAGSVVFRGNYPSDCIISGNPATISRSKNPSK